MKKTILLIILVLTLIVGSFILVIYSTYTNIKAENLIISNNINNLSSEHEIQQESKNKVINNSEQETKKEIEDNSKTEDEQYNKQEIEDKSNVKVEQNIKHETEIKYDSKVDPNNKQETEYKSESETEQNTKQETEQQNKQSQILKPSITVPQPETGTNLVWIPTNGGTKYHSYSGCSKMKNPIQVTQSTAESQGFTACKKCY